MVLQNTPSRRNIKDNNGSGSKSEPDVCPGSLAVKEGLSVPTMPVAQTIIRIAEIGIKTPCNLRQYRR